MNLRGFTLHLFCMLTFRLHMRHSSNAESDPRYGELTRPEFTPEFFHYHKVVPNMSLRVRLNFVCGLCVAYICASCVVQAHMQQWSNKQTNPVPNSHGSFTDDMCSIALLSSSSPCR